MRAEEVNAVRHKALWTVSAGLWTLWLCLLPLVARAQGRPDIVWMAVGHWFVNSVSFSPDGSLLASGSGYRDGSQYLGEIKLWRVSDGKLLRTYDQETGGGVLSIQFSPSGRLFGYGRWDATVVVAARTYSVSGQVKLQEYQGDVTTVLVTVQVRQNGNNGARGSAVAGRAVRLHTLPGSGQV